MMLRYITARFVERISSFTTTSASLTGKSLNSPGIFSFRSYKKIVLNEDDIEEKFVKGWGKGGQKVNKTSNCVELKHKPSGVIIKCHQSRSLVRNRAIARELLERKLDFIHNGSQSEIGQEIAQRKKRKSDRLRKRKDKEEVLKRSGHESEQE